MSKYKLIAIDCDGTLLKEDKSISLENQKSLSKLVSKDIIISIATGRSIDGIKDVCTLLSKNYPCITLNGAKIVMSKTREVIFESTMEKDDCYKVNDLSKTHEFTMFVWSKDKLYCNHFNQWTELYAKASEVEAHLIEDFDLLVEIGINKIVFIIDPSEISQYEKDFKKILKNSNCVSSTTYLLEFFNKNISKGIALEFLCNLYKINLNQTIAIGDANNDICMIEKAGFGVSMENATDDVKKASDYTTKSNEEDGVSLVINKFILEEIDGL